MAVKSLGKALKETSEKVKDKLAPTAVAIGLMSESEETEAAYIPLKAFAEGSEAAQALFKKAQKRIAEGADTRPNGELYNEIGVYRSEDGDLKVDVAELSARNAESLQGVQKFADDLDFYLSAKIKRKKKIEHPITRYLPEDSPIFKNFPDLKDVKVSIRPQPKDSNYLGEYDTDTNELIVYADNDPRIDYSEFEDERANKILNSFNTLIHEFQHYIQDVKKAANTGYNEVASLIASGGFRGDYKDAVEALENLQPGDIGYDQFKNKVDSVFGMVEKSLSARKKSKDAPSPRDEFISADFDEKLKTVERVFDAFEKGSSNTDELLQTSSLMHNIYIRELGEAEARSSGLKALMPEGSERKAIGVFYPTSSGKQTVLRAEDVSLANRLDPSHVLVRAIPAYEDFTDMNKLYFPESVMGLETVDPEIVTQAKKKSGDAGKGTAAVVAGGTAAGLASPPSEAFVEDLGQRTGLFEDGSPTASLFDVEGVSDELGISNTFLLDLLVPRTKPYDLISNIPGVGETMMAADLAQGLGSPDAETPDEFTDTPKDVAGMRQGGGLETEAGKEMEEKNPNKPIPEKADINKDGEIQGWEKARHEAIMKTDEKKTGMYAGGMMADPFAPLQVVIGIDEESGNEVPAGSKPEEVRDDIPAMLSEGEYVVPSDVVRYWGLRHLEDMRSEAKCALGLMAQHDRISMVDDETKEPVEYEENEVEYDIEEKDAPEVEEAEYEVVHAAEGADIQASPVTPSFYQLRYIPDPETGRMRMAYVDPTTGQEVSQQTYDPTRASRFSTKNVLSRDVFGPEDVEEAVEEAQEEEQTPACPVGQVYDSQRGRCVPIDQGGDGTSGTTKGPGRYGMSDAGYTLEDGTVVRSTDAVYTRIDPGFSKYANPEKVPDVVSGLIPGAKAIANAVNFVSKKFRENSLANTIRSGEYLGITPSTPDYGDWRNNMANDLAASVAESEFEARDVVSGDRDLGGSSFASAREAEAVSSSGWGSDEHLNTIDPDEESGLTGQFSFDAPTQAQIDAYNEAEAARAKEEGRAGNFYSSDDDNTETEDDTDSGFDPTGDGSDFYANKGGMPVRNSTPRKAMIKY